MSDPRPPEAGILEHRFVPCPKCKGQHLAIPGNKVVCHLDRPWTGAGVTRAS